MDQQAYLAYGKIGSAFLAIFAMIFRSCSFNGTNAPAWAKSKAILNNSQ